MSSIARAQIYQNGQINLTTLRMAMTPPVYVQQLISMGLANDPLTLPLLAKYIPMPDAVKAMNVTDNTFYNNISFYWSQFAFPPYDLTTLTDEISAKIVTPRINAQMMIDGHPYLTRLNTFISPEEMNKDPFFFETRDLTDVPNVHNAVLRTMCGNMEYMSCNAPQRLELPDGRMVWVRAGSKATTCAHQPSDRDGSGEAARGRGRVATRGDRPGHARGGQHRGDQYRDRGHQRHVPRRTDAVPDSDRGGRLGRHCRYGRKRRDRRRNSGDGGYRRRRAGNRGHRRQRRTRNGGHRRRAGPGTAGTGGGSVTGRGGSGSGVAGADGLGPSESGGGGCSCATGGLDGGARFTTIALAGVFGLTLLRRRRRTGR